MLAIALTLAVTAPQPTGDLIFLGASRTNMMLIEPASIRREGEFVLFDQISVMEVPESFYGGRLTRAKRFHYRADCLTNSMQVTGFRLLDGAGAQLADHSAGAPGAMMRAPRGSVADKALTMACTGELPTDQSEYLSDVPAAITAFYGMINTR